MKQWQLRTIAVLMLVSFFLGLYRHEYWNAFIAFVIFITAGYMSTLPDEQEIK